MTNNEAIVWLKETKKHYGEYHEKADEALDIAIKALEQPQGEWEITRETDIEVVAKDAYEQGYTDGWKERYGEPEERPQG